MADALGFEKTGVLFEKLVNVETYSRMFGGHLAHIQTLIGGEVPKDWYYVAPPDSDDQPELRALIEARRAEFKHKGRHHWSTLDQFHTLNRAWRKALEEAKRAADDATWELDPLPVAPLKRTAVRIKRCLQRMGGSVPSPMVIGDLPPLEPSYLERLRAQDREVERWVDEIRLLTYPRSPERPDHRLDGLHAQSKPESGQRPKARLRHSKPSSVKSRRSRRGRPPVPSDHLGERRLSILARLMERQAVGIDRAVKVNSLVDPSRGLTIDSLKKHFVVLKRLGLTDGKAGIGAWLTDAGLARARAATGSGSTQEASAEKSRQTSRH